MMKRENRALVQLLRECVIIIQQDGFDPMLVDAFQALNEYIENQGQDPPRRRRQKKDAIKPPRSSSSIHQEREKRNSLIVEREEKKRVDRQSLRDELPTSIDDSASTSTPPSPIKHRQKSKQFLGDQMSSEPSDHATHSHTAIPQSSTNNNTKRSELEERRSERFRLAEQLSHDTMVAQERTDETQGKRTIEKRRRKEAAQQQRRREEERKQVELEEEQQGERKRLLEDEVQRKIEALRCLEDEEERRTMEVQSRLNEEEAAAVDMQRKVEELRAAKAAEQLKMENERRKGRIVAEQRRQAEEEEARLKRAQELAENLRLELEEQRLAEIAELQRQEAQDKAFEEFKREAEEGNTQRFPSITPTSTAPQPLLSQMPPLPVWPHPQQNGHVAQPPVYAQPPLPARVPPTQQNYASTAQPPSNQQHPPQQWQGQQHPPAAYHTGYPQQPPQVQIPQPQQQWQPPILQQHQYQSQHGVPPTMPRQHNQTQHSNMPHSIQPQPHQQWQQRAAPPLSPSQHQQGWTQHPHNMQQQVYHSHSQYSPQQNIHHRQYPPQQHFPPQQQYQGQPPPYQQHNPPQTQTPVPHSPGQAQIPVPPPAAADSKYAKMVDQKGDDDPVIKRNILIHWALQPPAMQTLRPIGALITTIHSIFPPAFGVASHTYFSKWIPVSLQDVGSDDGVKKAVKKLRFFLHPDKLPNNLDKDQQFICKMLWDVANDAFHEFEKKQDELDWIGN